MIFYWNRRPFVVVIGAFRYELEFMPSVWMLRWSPDSSGWQLAVGLFELSHWYETTSEAR